MSHWKPLLLACAVTACLASLGCDRDPRASQATFSKAAARVAVSVTAVEGSTVTVRYADGRLQRLELESAAGIKLGMSSWCEEDCGRGLSLPDRYVRVVRVLR